MLRATVFLLVICYLVPISFSATYVYKYEGIEYVVTEKNPPLGKVPETRLVSMSGTFSFDAKRNTNINVRLGDNLGDTFARDTNTNGISSFTADGQTFVGDGTSENNVRLTFWENPLPTSWGIGLDNGTGLRMTESENSYTFENDFEKGGTEWYESVPATGTWTLEAVTAPDHIIVLTHGWQDEVDFESTASYMSQLEETIYGSRTMRDQSRDNLKILSPKWEGAFTQDDFTSSTKQSRFNSAVEATEDAGIDIANQIQQFINDTDLERKSLIPSAEDYNPTIQLIGHGLGTMVNAYSVNSLYSSGIKVDQVTLLNTPVLASGDAFLRELMPKGSVRFVENYYSSRESPEGEPSFGQPIAGANPCFSSLDDGTLSCTGWRRFADHNTIWSEEYRDEIVDGGINAGWATPATYAGRGVEAGTLPRFDNANWVEWDPTPPEHIIVLTHGWQPGRDQETTESYMKIYEEQILSRLSAQGIDPATVAFVTEEWEEAFTPAIDIFSSAGREKANTEYLSSYRSSSAVGTRIADRVATLVDASVAAGKDPTIHIIGHSLGTVVNANVVNNLYNRNNSDYKIDRVTILDSPKNASMQVANELLSVLNEQEPHLSSSLKYQAISADDGLLFYTLMPIGSVDYVDNFYGDFSNIDAAISLILKNLRTAHFGQPIAGTGPCVDGSCSGIQLNEADHGNVVGLYSSLIGDFRRLANPGGDTISWGTPALGPASSYDIPWDPTIPLLQWIADAAAGNLNLAGIAIQSTNGNFLKSAATGNSSIVDNWHSDFGSVLETAKGVSLVSNSPTSLSADVSYNEILSLSFVVDATEADQGMFSVLIGDITAWEIDTSDPLNRIIHEVNIPTALAFGSQEVTWLYDSEVIGSRIHLSDLSFMQLTSVPEPSSLAVSVILLAVFFLKRCRQ